MVKKNLAIVLAILMMFALAGCGAQEKMNEKIAEKVTEGVLNSATDGNAKVDLDGDQVKIKGKDGEEFTFGDTKWPNSGAAQLIPEFKKGKVMSAMNSEEACMIIIEEVGEKDFKDYIEEIKGQGFTNNTTEYTSGTGQGYSANKEENEVITVLYDSETEALHVNYEVRQ